MSDQGGTIEPIPTTGGVAIMEDFIIAEANALLEPDLADLIAAKTVNEALGITERSLSTLDTRFNPLQAPIGRNALESLQYAYRTGEVHPAQSIEALQYAMLTAGKLIMRPGGVNGHTLPGELSAYAVHVHNHTHPPIKLPGTVKAPAPRPVATSISVGVTVPEPNTPGGKIVAQAEAAIKTVRVTVPGLTQVETRGISIAIAHAYQDTLSVIVSALNHVEAQITALGRTVAAQGHTGTTTAKTVTKTAPSVTHTLNALKATQASLSAEVRHLETLIQGLQAQITSIKTQPPVITPTPAPVTSSPLSPTDRALIDSIPLLATTASVTQASLVANAANTLALQNQAVLGDSYVPNLPSTINSLEECCAANSNITNPIRSGGATPGLLSGLGGLLAKGAMLAVGAGILETIIALFDMPDVILGEVQSMQWVRPIAEAAARGALANTQWSKQLNPGVP